jgi:Golgi phosphoprotein 3
MATTTSGLTRRRGAGGGGGANGDGNGSNGIGSRSSSAANVRDSAPETSYESGENGHRIAFDPRDISESAERSKQPKLTLMEEVLLLGLKDKQVCRIPCLSPLHFASMSFPFDEAA